MSSQFEKLAYLSNLQNAASTAQDWFTGAIGRIRNLATPQPAAYSRITRTPIYVQDQPGLAGSYRDGKITLSPDHWDAVPHESAHAIYDQAHLKSQASSLAPQVGEGQRNRILADPVYKNMPEYGSAEQLSDEGLGFSIGRPDATAYVDKVAGAIADPTLADRLRRLNVNALGSTR